MNELPPQNEVAQEDPFVTETREKLERYFEQEPDPNERVDVILRSLEPFIEKMPEEEASRLAKEIEELRTVTNKEQFVASYMDACSKLFDMRKNDLEEFERLMRDASIRAGEREAASDLVTYEIKHGQVNVHLYDTESLEPYKSVSGVKKALLLRKDFEKALGHFVNLFRQKEHLKNIHGVSYLIAENPKLFESYGFILDPNNLSDDEKRKQFGKTEREVRVANIPREVLLSLYDENGKRKEKTA